MPRSNVNVPRGTFAVAPVLIATIKFALAVLASTTPSPNANVSGLDTILVNTPAVKIAPCIVLEYVVFKLSTDFTAVLGIRNTNKSDGLGSDIIKLFAESIDEGATFA